MVLFLWYTLNCTPFLLENPPPPSHKLHSEKKRSQTGSCEAPFWLHFFSECAARSLSKTVCESLSEHNYSLMSSNGTTLYWLLSFLNSHVLCKCSGGVYTRSALNSSRSHKNHSWNRRQNEPWYTRLYPGDLLGLVHKVQLFSFMSLSLVDQKVEKG